MSYMTAFLLSLPLITKIFGLGPADPNPAISLPVSSTPSLPQLVNISNTTDAVGLVDVGVSVPKCDGTHFGWYLNITSCEAAWEKIPTGSATHEYGSRAQGVFARPLPYRYLSGKFSATHNVKSACC